MDVSALGAGDVAYLGIACDHNSSFMRGPADAPARVREVLYNGASGLTAETGEPVVDHPAFHDLGDIHVEETDEAYLGIEQQVAPILEAGARPLIVGGDHAVSYPVLRAVTEHHGPLTIVHFDAHADLYDEFEGRRFSHACPFARVMEHCPEHRLIQIGVRSVNRHLLHQALRFGVHTVPANEFTVDRVPTDIHGPTYISVDIDALDPAFAPGVSHHEPGGLTTRDLLSVVQNLRSPVIGADIVEFNPGRDVNDMTAMVTAKLVRELGDKLLP